MVESVDKRDERDSRTGGAEPGPSGPTRDVGTTRADDAIADMSDKKTSSFGSDGVDDASRDGFDRVGDEPARPVERAEPAAPPEVFGSDPLEYGPVNAPTAPVVRASARVIPFVPRNGVIRPTPAPTSESRFARPAAGPAAYDVGVDAARRQPALPPPPSGFRRTPNWEPVDRNATDSVKAEPLLGEGARRVAAQAARVFQSATQRLRTGWSVWRALKYLLVGFFGLLLAYAVAVTVLAVAYRWINPPMSTLMLSQRLAGTEISRGWTPIEQISPHLLQAVILSEDGQFCRHRGVDWLAMKEAIEQSLDGNARGGSTISMQTVKNLFLWPSKSYVRKAIELPLAMGTEMIWPKQRMLELYLNIAEWGPGIFGADAAARYHFGKSAGQLTPREASLLAVALPNPIERVAGQPSAGQQRLAERLQARMRRVPNAAACATGARGASPPSSRTPPGDAAGQRRNYPL